MCGDDFTVQKTEETLPGHPKSSCDLQEKKVIRMWTVGKGSQEWFN